MTQSPNSPQAQEVKAVRVFGVYPEGKGVPYIFTDLRQAVKVAKHYGVEAVFVRVTMDDKSAMNSQGGAK